MKKASRSILLVLLVAGAFLGGSWHNQRKAATNAHMGARKVLHYVDPMHPAYKSDRPGIAPDCGMELVPVYADGAPADAGRNGDFMAPGAVTVSPEQQQLFGVRVSRVEQSSGNHTLRLFGRVAPDETRVYRLNAGIEGSIRQVSSATTGSQINKGQLLATFVAPDFVTAIQGYIIALDARDRLKQSHTVFSTQIDPTTGNPTNTNFEQRLERLENMGMSSAQIEDIGRTRELPKAINILAPADGFLLARNVSPNQKFDRGMELYRIADLRRVWILADVFGREASMVRPGATARVSLAEQGLVLDAKVSDVLPQFDANTRTLKVRLEADNPGYVLRPDMFVDVQLAINLPPSISVPADAVLDSGLKKTVFVERNEGSFEPREVQTGWRFDDQVQIVQGLAAGERIAVSGNFLISSESRLKAAADGMHLSVKDPVCGMELNQVKANAASSKSEYGGMTHYFCSRECKRKFDREPDRYLGKPPGEEQLAAPSIEHRHLPVQRIVPNASEHRGLHG